MSVISQLQEMEKKDPYRHIRRDTPPTGGAIKSKKQYNRQENKKELYQEVKDFCGSLLEEDADLV